MDTLVNILIVGDDEPILDRLDKALLHPQITIERASSVPEKSYHFYVLGKSLEIDKSVDTIRKHSPGSPIYLYGSVCDKRLPLRQVTKCNIAACLESKENLTNFIKEVRTLRKNIAKIHEASCKLDCLKAGDLKTLAKQMRKAEAEKFVDFIQNHPLPMVLVSNEHEVLHANTAMEDMIGIRLAGAPVTTFWDDQNALAEVLSLLKKEGQLLGKEVTLKNVNGELLQLKLYTSLHYNKAGNWINSRCLFVPVESPNYRTSDVR